MRASKTIRKPAGRHTRGVGIFIGCAGFLCAAIAANPAAEHSDAPTSKAAPKEIPESTLRLYAKYLRESDDFMEGKLRRWTPTAENDQVPSPVIRSLNVDIPGEWRVHQGGYEGSSLIISRSGPNGYNVFFSTYGCLGNWKLHRTGRYAGGILVLNRPVEQYGSPTYQKLYAVRVGQMDFLVPDALVGEFQKEIRLDGRPFVYGMGAYFFGFTRTATRTPGRPDRGRGSPPP